MKLRLQACCGRLCSVSPDEDLLLLSGGGSFTKASGKGRPQTGT